MNEWDVYDPSADADQPQNVTPSSDPGYAPQSPASQNDPQVIYKYKEASPASPAAGPPPSMQPAQAFGNQNPNVYTAGDLPGAPQSSFHEQMNPNSHPSGSSIPTNLGQVQSPTHPQNSPSNSAGPLKQSGSNAGGTPSQQANSAASSPAPTAVPGQNPDDADTEQIPELVQAYVEPRKNNTIVLILAGLLMVLMICGTLVIMAGKGAKTENNPGLVRYREERDYLVLSPSTLLTEAKGEASNGMLNPGQIVFIKETAQSKDGETWGMVSDDQWVLLSDPDYIYLLDESLASWDAKEENKEYKAVKEGSVYAVPGAVSKPISHIQEGDTVYILETALTEGGKWGRIGLNQWVLIEQNGEDYLVVNEEAVQEVEDDKESDEKDEEDENPGAKKIDGFKTGIYELDFAMNIRRKPSFEGEEVKTLPAGTLVRVAWLRKVEDQNSIWGELDDRGSGYWVCLKASGTTYATWQDPDEQSTPAVNPAPVPDYPPADNVTPEPSPAPDHSSDEPNPDPFAPEGPIVDDNQTATDPNTWSQDQQEDTNSPQSGDNPQMAQGDDPQPSF